MDQKNWQNLLKIRKYSVEEVWIKNEPIDVESAANIHIKCEEEISIVDTEPATDEVSVTTSTVSIKSEITLGDYECIPSSRNLSKRKRTKKERQKRIANTVDRKFHCECGAKFARKDCLQVHQRKHTGERPFGCEECAETFTSQYCFKVHQQNKHTGQIPFGCDECDKKFYRKNVFTKHKRFHSAERPFACDICLMRFTQSGHLGAHKRKHTGEKPFACIDCDMTFMYASLLKHHKNMHTTERPSTSVVTSTIAKKSPENVSIKSENVSNDYEFISSSQNTVKRKTTKKEKPKATDKTVNKNFNCDDCGAKFALKHSLKIHRRKHTGERPYSCDECGKAFFRKSIFTKHKRFHTGEKPYACDICGMRFAQSGHLKPHKKVHTGERPFECPECGSKFAYKKGLKQHEKLHLNQTIFCCNICKIKFDRKEHLERHSKEKHS